MSAPTDRGIVIDSSVFVSALSPEEPHAAASRAFFRTLAEGSYTGIVPATVILEVGNVLLREGRLGVAATVLADFRTRFENFHVIILDEEFVTQALLLFPGLNLRTGDAIIAVTAEIHGALLVSWDRRLLRGAQRRVQTATPRTFLRTRGVD